MRGKLLLLATSMSLMLATASAQARPTTDTKVHEDRKVQPTELVAPMEFTPATALEYSKVVLTATKISDDVQLVGIEVQPAVATPRATIGSPKALPSVATAVVAPPNPKVEKVNARRRHNYSEEKAEPNTTILHPDPGRQR